MMALAAGMSLTEFYDAAPRDVNACIKAYYEREKNEWNRARVVSYYSVVPHMKNAPRITKFMPFDWDAPMKANVREITEGEKEWLKRFERRMDKRTGRDKE